MVVAAIYFTLSLILHFIYLLLCNFELIFGYLGFVFRSKCLLELFKSCTQNYFHIWPSLRWFAIGYIRL